jgi:hypothetical protein
VPPPDGYTVDTQAPASSAPAGYTLDTGDAPPGSPTSRFFSNLLSAVNPLPALNRYVIHGTSPDQDVLRGDYLGALRDVIPGASLATDLVKAQVDQGSQAVQSVRQGNYSEAAGHGLAAITPIFGPPAARAGEQIASGDWAGGAGSAVGLIGSVLAPEVVAKGLGKLGSKIAPPFNAQAVNLYRSALKPSVTLSPEEANAVAATGVQNRIAISDGGLTKLRGIVDDANAQIRNIIQPAAQAGATVDPVAIAQRADATKQFFTNQVDPDADLAAIDGVKARFLARHSTPGTPAQPPSTLTNAAGQPLIPGTPATPGQPVPIPVDQAQAIKEGTYAQLRGKYGELSSAEVQAQKALARGAKEELANQFPELNSLNAKESQMLNLEEPLERAINREGNKEPLGLPMTLALIGGQEAAGAGGLAMGGFLSKIISNPAMRSRLAIGLDMASRKAGTLAGKPFQVGAGRMGQITGAIDSYTQRLQDPANYGGGAQPPRSEPPSGTAAQ